MTGLSLWKGTTLSGQQKVCWHLSHSLFGNFPAANMLINWDLNLLHITHLSLCGCISGVWCQAGSPLEVFSAFSAVGRFLRWRAGGQRRGAAWCKSVFYAASRNGCHTESMGTYFAHLLWKLFPFIRSVTGIFHNVCLKGRWCQHHFIDKTHRYCIGEEFWSQNFSFEEHTLKKNFFSKIVFFPELCLWLETV